MCPIQKSFVVHEWYVNHMKFVKQCYANQSPRWYRYRLRGNIPAIKVRIQYTIKNQDVRHALHGLHVAQPAEYVKIHVILMLHADHLVHVTHP